MSTKQTNPYADLVVVCRGDQRYGGEKTYEDHVLVSVLAGELRVVQANRTRHCGAGDTVLLPRNQPATLLKYPKDGTPYQAVIMTLPTAMVQAYYAANPPAPAGPAHAGLLVFPKNPLLQSVFASLLPYLEFDVERAVADIKTLGPGTQVLPVSARSGDGLKLWYRWLEDRTG